MFGYHRRRKHRDIMVEILAAQYLINLKQIEIMAQFEDFAAELTVLETAIAAIPAVVVADPTAMTAAQAAETIARLQADVAKVAALSVHA